LLIQTTVVANKVDLVSSEPTASNLSTAPSERQDPSINSPSTSSPTLEPHLQPRAISYQAGQTFAKEHNLMYVETSAKEGWGVVEAFEKTAREVLKRHGKEELARRGKKVSFAIQVAGRFSVRAYVC
jgi:hypothetical protein